MLTVSNIGKLSIARPKRTRLKRPLMHTLLRHIPRLLADTLPTRFVHLQRGDRRIQTFNRGHYATWRDLCDDATDALHGWSLHMPPDELHLIASNEEWPR